MSEHKEGGERPRFQLEVKNRFIVEGPRSGTSLDNNVVEMNAESIATLGVSSHIALARRALMNFVLQEGDEEVFEGDIVVLRGKMKRKMYCVVLVNDDISNGEIICNDVVRKNLKARLGDRITVRPVDSAPSAQKVTIARIEDDNDDESQVVGESQVEWIPSSVARIHLHAGSVEVQATIVKPCCCLISRRWRTVVDALCTLANFSWFRR